MLAGAWYTLTLLGATPVVYAIPWAVHAAVAWMLVNVGLVWLAIRRIRADKYAPERRSSVRFETDLAARVDGIEAWVRDLSLTGARLEVPPGVILAPATRLTVDTGDGQSLDLHGSIRGRWTDPDGATILGFEFDDGQYDVRACLALTLFGATAPPGRATVSARVPTAPEPAVRSVGSSAA